MRTPIKISAFFYVSRGQTEKNIFTNGEGIVWKFTRDINCKQEVAIPLKFVVGADGQQFIIIKRLKKMNKKEMEDICHLEFFVENNFYIITLDSLVKKIQLFPDCGGMGIYAYNRFNEENLDLNSVVNFKNQDR